jgi:hypothetical protein
MNRSHYDAMIYKVHKEVLLLKEDVKHVNHPGIKRGIENEIAQKLERIRFLMEKTKAPPPVVMKKGVDKEIQKTVI